MKKIFSAILMAAMAFSGSVFVACNDLVDEVESVQSQATQNTAAIDAINSKIADLESRLAAAQNTATAAEAAAKAAKEAGDAAKAEAEAAKAAAATAEANAIAAAKEQIETLKKVYDAKVAEIEAALAGKASIADVEAAVAAATKDAQAALDLLVAKVDAKADKTEVEALVAADAAINKEIEALKTFKALVEELDLEALSTNVDSLELNLAAAKEQIDEIWAAVEENYTELYDLIGKNASSITAWGEDLQASIDGFYAEVFDTTNPNSVMSILASYANIIAELQAKVDGLSMLQERILSIAYAPEVLLDGRGVIDFNSLYVWDDDWNLVFITGAPTTATYIVNPTKANLEGVQFEMSTRGVQTRADEIATISVNGFEVGQGGKQGRVQLDLVANGNLPYCCNQMDLNGGWISEETFEIWNSQEGVYETVTDYFKNYWLAKMPTNQVLATLVATAPNGDVVYSDEAFVQEKSIVDYDLINKKDYATDKSFNSLGYDKLYETAAQYRYNLELVYNETINVYDYLETSYFYNRWDLLTNLNVTPSYKVSLVEKYIGTDGETNQQKFVTFDPETGDLKVNTDFVSAGRPAIGRTPALKVEAQVLNTEGELVTLVTRYIIFKIVDKATEPVVKEPVKVTIDADFLYTDLLDGRYPTEAKNGLMVLDWETVNTKIYDALGMTHSEFRNNYWLDSFYYLDAEGKEANFPSGIAYNEEWLSNQTTTVNPVEIIIFNAIPENISGSVVAVLKGSGADVNVIFNFSVAHEHVWPEFNPDYTLTISEEERAELELGDMTVIQVKGKLGGANEAKWVLQSEMKEHFFEYLKGYENPANHGDLFFYFPISATEYEATITGETWKDQEIALNEPLEGEHKDVLVGMGIQLANGNYCTKEYVVRFVNPFVATLTDVTLKTYVAKHDAKSLLANLTIKDRDGYVIYGQAGKTIDPSGTYKFTAEDFNIEFFCEPDASFGDKLNLYPENDWTLDWYNGGTDLQQDKTTTYGVKVAIDGISVVVAEGNVKVLSTEHSK